MCDYSKSKIYMIEPTCDYEEGNIYIGSTTRSLSERMNEHKKPCNSTNSKILFQKYNNNCKIVLIEEYPCETRKQLNKKEGEHIRSKKCVNTQMAGIKKTEYNKQMYYKCECGQLYMDNSGLWRHKKKCNNQTEKLIKEKNIDKELILLLLNDNKDLKQMIIEQNNTILDILKNSVNITANTKYE